MTKKNSDFLKEKISKIVWAWINLKKLSPGKSSLWSKTDPFC